MNKYIYPALFELGEDRGYTVTFPDIPGCITEGLTIEQAFQMAKEALELYMYNIEDDGEEIPVPSLPSDIKIPEKNAFVSLVEAWMPPVRDEMENRAVKKTLTIPKWLNDAAEEKQVNFSQVLQTALKSHLGIAETKK